MLFKLLALLSITCFAFSTVGCATTEIGNVTEQGGTPGLEYTSNGNSYSITGTGSATDTEIVIPHTYKGKPVVGIGENAFRECLTVASITIPDSITRIDANAFYGCENLTEITFGNGLCTVGGSAFSGCTNITNVYIADIAAWCSIEFANIRANPLSYASTAYLNDTPINNLTIIENVTSINDYAFYGHEGLESVTIGNAITTIGSHAFEQCRSLKEVTIGNSVTLIGQEAFRDCDNLSNINISESVTNIMNAAFYNCESLSSITIPQNVSYIGNGTFYNCDSLTDIYFESSSGWWVARYYLATSGTDISESELTDSKQAAELLIDGSLYAFYNWKHN